MHEGLDGERHLDPSGFEGVDESVRQTEVGEGARLGGG